MSLLAFNGSNFELRKQGLLGWRIEFFKKDTEKERVFVVDHGEDHGLGCFFTSCETVTVYLWLALEHAPLQVDECHRYYVIL